MEMGKSWNGQRVSWRGSLCRSDNRITVGVCAREKKARSKHMEAITSRLDPEKFEVIIFGDSCILNAAVEDWPMCDCLIAFYSTGFPSEKAQQYVNLRRPYTLNNLEMGEVLHDRRMVYDLLKVNKVPHPENVYASRDGYGGMPSGELKIVEADDFIQVNDVTIHKPFVEKPVDAENHNIYIYYPMSAGGGSKRLFRKVGDRSSEFYPDVNEIRRDGSYIYEAFVETQGTDVKVYTVGPDYGHAEARKSPTLDGKVNRNAEGKEERYPVILSKDEKEYARKITLAFKQCVCGFDILRVQGRSYVCDVNGWSFVKNSRKYVEDCAMLLQEFVEAAVRPGRKTSVFSTEAPLIKYQAINTQQHVLVQGERHLEKPLRIKEVGSGAVPMLGSPASTPPRTPPPVSTSAAARRKRGEGRSMRHPRKHAEELRAVIAIIRHGDRTPKQKMKMIVSFPQFLAFYNKYSPGPRNEIKVKGKAHLKEFLGITVDLINTMKTPSPPDGDPFAFSADGSPPQAKSTSRSTETDSEGSGGEDHAATHTSQEAAGAGSNNGHGKRAQGLKEVDAETYGKLHQIKHVLERWEISGINRKLQLKPRQWKRDSVVQVTQSPEADRKASASRTTGRDTGGGQNKTCGGTTDSDAVAQSHERATQLLLILKWGGELTKLGQRQAIELGNSFRTIMYPDSGAGGLLRLHSTFRHDLKIKTSDEGRVMKTAAAFAKGFLELEGELTPILVSLVSKESSKTSSVMMLDQSGNKDIKKEMERSKDFLRRVMAQDVAFPPELIKTVVPTSQASVRRALRSLGNPVAKLHKLRQLVAVLVKQLSRKSATVPLGVIDRVSAADRERDRGVQADEFATSRVEAAEKKERKKGTGEAANDEDFSTPWDSRLPARGETPLLMLDRWRKLHDELYDGDTGFDITKVRLIPDVHDNVRYDGLHNSHLDLDGLPELYDLAKNLADSIVPQEYGITRRDKLVIGSKMCSALLDKIKNDLIIARSDNEVDMRYQLDVSNVEDLPISSLGRRVRTRLYFTSESHLHTLLNVLRFPVDGHECVITAEAKRMLSRTKELCYLTSFVIRLFENAEKSHDDPERFRVEILFSPGVVKHPLLPGDHLHTAPLVPLHKNLNSEKLESTLNSAIALAAEEGENERDREADDMLKNVETLVQQQKQYKHIHQQDAMLQLDRGDHFYHPLDTNSLRIGVSPPGSPRHEAFLSTDDQEHNQHHAQHRQGENGDGDPTYYQNNHERQHGDGDGDGDGDGERDGQRDDPPSPWRPPEPEEDMFSDIDHDPPKLHRNRTLLGSLQNVARHGSRRSLFDDDRGQDNDTHVGDEDGWDVSGRHHRWNDGEKRMVSRGAEDEGDYFLYDNECSDSRSHSLHQSPCGSGSETDEGDDSELFHRSPSSVSLACPHSSQLGWTAILARLGSNLKGFNPMGVTLGIVSMAGVIAATVMRHRRER